MVFPIDLLELVPEVCFCTLRVHKFEESSVKSYCVDQSIP